MITNRAVRWVIHGIAMAVGVAAILHSLIAPLILLLAVVYLVAILLFLVLEGKIDRLSVVLSITLFSIFVVVFFLPLWIEELKIQTPEGHLELAEKFASRGQLFGNSAKVLNHYRLAAEGGNIEAQTRLGEALCFGHYGNTDLCEGMKWLSKAAANGNRRAQMLIASFESD